MKIEDIKTIDDLNKIKFDSISVKYDSIWSNIDIHIHLESLNKKIFNAYYKDFDIEINKLYHEIKIYYCTDLGIDSIDYKLTPLEIMCGGIILFGQFIKI